MIYVPIASFPESAKALRGMDLRRQRGEVVKCLNIGGGFMWEEYCWALSVYGLYLVSETASRPNLANKSVSLNATEDHGHIVKHWYANRKMNRHLVLPWWWGDAQVHDSHKAALLRRHEAYRKLWPRIDMDMPLYLPEGEEEF